MIEKLSIQNFQSHKDTTLNFVKGLNAIVGETDSGKSAIIRALKLVIYNTPSGDAYRSNWGGETSVSISTDKETITRTKGSSKNTYELSTIDAPFTAFGQTVPDEIQEALNMDEVNLQQQLDSHFLLSETSGKVALHFNKIAKLDKIDRATGKVQKEINTINSETKHRQNELERKLEKLKEFPNLAKLEKELTKIETLENTKQKKENQHQELTKLGNTIYGIEQEIYLTQQEIKAEESIDTILNLYKTKQEKENQIHGINQIGGLVNVTGMKITKAENKIKAEAGINKLLKLYEKQQKADASATQLEKLYDTIEFNQETLKTQENELKDLEATYKKNFPEICPLCNSKIK